MEWRRGTARDEILYQFIRDTCRHVGHENSTRLVVDNSLHVTSLHSHVTES